MHGQELEQLTFQMTRQPRKNTHKHITQDYKQKPLEGSVNESTTMIPNS